MLSLARLATRHPQSSSRALLSSRSRYYSSEPPSPPSSIPGQTTTHEATELIEEAVNEDSVDLDDYYFETASFPDLMKPHALMDLHEAVVSPPSTKNPHGSKIIVRNDPSMFKAGERAAREADPSQYEETEEETAPVKKAQGGILNNLPLSAAEMKELHYYPIFTRRITQQTGKGKIHRQYSLVVVGNGNGLVGYGEGKDDELPRATEKAYAEAVRTMDHVERFEQRTLWTDMHTKFGATSVTLRPRPLGFGLRCNPNIHQILKAAGIKDVSAKVWGSRNPINVMKATFRMLQAGNAPQSMGNGIGGGARKSDRGSGVRGKGDVERERGRKMVDLRTQ